MDRLPNNEEIYEYLGEDPDDGIYSFSEATQSHLWVAGLAFRFIYGELFSLQNPREVASA